MKARDFRIGNLIKYSEDGTVFEITEIDKLGFEVKNENEETWIEHDLFEPIQLTEEWLIKFGFKKIGTKTYFDYHIGNFFIYIIGCSLKEKNFYFSSCDEYRITTVHQLQNIYFALTGEELICHD